MTVKGKVCHITTVHWAKDVRIFLKECNSLASNGYDVHLIAPNRGETDFGQVTFHGISAPSESRPKRMWHSVNEAYKQMKKVNADVYHIHDPELLRLVPKIKRLGKSVIYDVHEDLPRQILSKFYIKPTLRKTIAWVIERFEDGKAKGIDAIITATPFIAKRFLQHNLNTFNVNNYPDGLMFFPLEGKEKKRQICYAGGISQIRGMDEILDAMLLLPDDVKLILAGPFSDPNYEKELMQHPGWSKVEYRGYLSKDEVNELYNESLLGLVLLLAVPNHIDALPMKMFEYMSAKLPVLASNFPLWQSIVEAGHAGLHADPTNAKQVAEAIMKVVDNPDLARQLGENGFRLVHKKYNWPTEVKTLLECYDKVFEKRSRAK
jgi:glycosyltransferase involved in cell wall biosynthesis